MKGVMKVNKKRKEVDIFPKESDMKSGVEIWVDVLNVVHKKNWNLITLYHSVKVAVILLGIYNSYVRNVIEVSIIIYN